MKNTRHLVAFWISTLLIGYSQSQNTIPLSCEDGWELRGSTCYKAFQEAMAWRDASDTCRNYGSRLVRIFGYEENTEIAEVASDAGLSSYWIGMNRLGLDNPLDTSDTEVHWAGGRRSGEPESTIYEGFWIENQPDVRVGSCARVVMDPSQYYDVGWEFINCMTSQGFMCETRAGLQGSFRCANGRYITNTVCDGEDDCGDNSDEMQCASECRQLLTGAGGTGMSSGNPYASNVDCLWTIEGPVGTRVSLEFTSFNTEAVLDVVTILIGGKTESTSEVLTRLSGNLNIGDLPRYYSSNNFMLVKFRSDDSVGQSGFEFDWITDPQFPGGVEEVTSSTTPTEIISPNYGQVLANTRHQWVVRDPVATSVLSFQVLELDIPEGAYVYIHDGEDSSAPLLDTLTSEHNPMSVISTSNVASVYYSSGDEHYRDKMGFILSYQTGCNGTINADHGYVVSPGYNAGLNYPNSQTCTWSIGNADLPRLHLAFRDPFGLEQDQDFLQVFDGADDSGTEIGTYTGPLLPSSVGLSADSGQMYLQMDTNSIINARGFRIDFSVPCPDPNFNAQNQLIPRNYGVTLDSVVAVSCLSGYEFAQEEHEGESQVTMTCMAGGWDVRQTPQCEPVWCGQAPLIDNGFYLSSTGSRNGDTVTYGCYDGFTMTGSQVITCGSDGQWLGPPMCQASSCTALPPTLVYGNKVYTQGTGPSFGAIVEYSCNDGYQLDGVASIICTEDGWSDAEPTCVILQCPFEFFQSRVQNAVFAPSSGPVEVGDTVTVTCLAGFTLADPSMTTTTVTCMPDQTFGAVMPMCADMNECDTSPCEGMCENTPGSYVCSCPEGSRSNGDFCEDINECDPMTGFAHLLCSQLCVDDEGSYHCECNLPGYTLYTEPGTQGHDLFPNEDGLVPGDTHYINHTCVRNQCPALPTFENGNILSTQTQFHFEDRVAFFCDIGYVLNGTETIECMADGSWSVDPSAFTCDPARCEIPDFSGLQYPPTVQGSSESVAYFTNVFFFCTHLRPVTRPSLFARRCNYDYSDGQYKLFKQNDTMECPIIDCGDPTLDLPAGSSVVDTTLTTTYWQSTFEIQCANLFMQEGNTTAGNNVVECADNGKWDYGAFQCNGAGCTDPGTNAGTEQLPEGTYEPGQMVYYQCTETGFTLDDPYPLLCEIIGDTPMWNGTAPSCADTTAPVASQASSLCGTTVTIASLAAPDFALPTATDNTGATDQHSLSVDWSADNNDPSIALTADKTFSYTFTDLVGLTATCDIDVVIHDNTLPSVTCPTSFSYTVDGNEVIEVPGTLSSIASSSLPIVYSPETFSSGPSRIGEYEVITATVTDTVGRQASCQYMVVFAADSCSADRLSNPLNGVTACTSTGNGYSCTATCNPGYYFYDLSTDSTLESSTSYSCTAGGSFPVDRVPDCVQPTRARYFFRYEAEYSTSDAAGTQACLTSYRSTFSSLLGAPGGVSSNMADICETGIRNFLTVLMDVDVTPSTTPEDLSLMFDSDTNSLRVNMTFSLTPDTLTENTVEDICLALFTTQFLGWGSGVSSLQNIPATASCPALTSDTFSVEKIDLPGDLFGEYRCIAQGRKLVSSTNSHWCLPCPYGRYYDAGQGECMECAFGEYQNAAGRTSCRTCTAGTSTASTGATSQDECIATCNTGELAGFVSSTGLPPCSQCPQNQYASDQTTCSLCPSNTATTGTGATSDTECQGACAAGSYSPTGFEPCTLCPLHFYQSAGGQTTCAECSAVQFTQQAGSTLAAQCLSGETEICTNNDPCVNGVCSFANHHAFCTCEPGWTGTECDVQINFCESNPCYYGKPCTPTLDGYTCSCGAGFSGDRCEVDPDDCATISCSNGGMCQDLDTSHVCLCPAGFTGSECTEAEDICTAAPCANGGTCRAVSSRRRVCDCMPGFEGEDCSDNQDNCASYPCSFGFTCTDFGDSYRCDCPEGFGDRDCSVRPDVCTLNNTCGDTALCVDDYTTNSMLCVCNAGFSDVRNTRENTWLEDYTGLTIDEECPSRDYCVGSPCENGAACTSTTSGESCACPAGYSGYHCQHDIDDCSGEPCGAFGTCIDGVDAYTCQCMLGYTGDNCETEINECQTPAYPCVAAGTDEGQFDNGCQDLENSFRCACLPGYAGDDCGMDLNECMSNPCMHEAACVNLPDDYMCECPEGWTGKRCDVVQEYCDPDPCQNNAECATVFGNFTCICEFPFHGTLCENEADTCNDANPCIDPDSQCFTDPGGLAECICSSAYAGSGCHVSVDFCAHDNFCGFNGQCHPCLDDFDCDCGLDFSGDQCETSADDCATVTCVGGATCMDGIGEYVCLCPVGMQGPNCNKETDTDYDLHFYDDARTGAAYQQYPFPFGGPDVDEVTVGLWVRFSESQGEGTFFTLYGLDQPMMTSPKRVLLQYDHEQIRLTFTPVAREDVDFGVYDINDGNWYYVMLTWSKVTGQLQVFVNAVLLTTIELYARGDDLPAYGMVLLGTEFEDNSFESIRGSGFNGLVSHVYMWNVILDRDTEISLMSDSREPLVQTGALMIDWAYYVTERGVEVARPSTAGDDVCPIGFTGPTCSTRLPDKDAPSIVSCPRDVYVTTTQRVTQVEWDVPEFEDHVGDPVSVYPSGNVFIWGRYNNWYVATDANGNTAICSFDIYVRGDDCPAPGSPTNGVEDCSDDTNPEGDFFPYRYCRATCSSNYAFPVPTPDFYTCGPQGAFNVHNMFLDFRYPSCGAIEQASTNITINLTYRAITACDDIVTVSGFEIRILTRLEELNALWLNRATGEGGFCGADSCNIVVTVETECVDNGANVRRRRQATSDADVSVTLTDIQDPLVSAADGSIERNAADILQQDIMDNGGFDFSDQITGAVPDASSVTVTEEPACSAGYMLESGVCVQCSVGTMYDAASASCVQCPLGYYQDQPGQSMCIECGSGFTTQLVGSESASDCSQDVCAPGNYYNSGSNTCAACEIGFYQPDPNQYFCYPCSADKTTAAEGSVSETDCYEICPDGTQLVAGVGVSTCEPCPLGTYRTQGLHSICESCPTGFTTENTMSLTAAQCTVRECFAGTFINDTEDCEPCPQGSYSDQDYQTTCTNCTAQFTTLSTGSAAASDCLFYCPPGEEESSSNAGQCVECPIESYKDNNNAGEMCQPCPNGFVSANPGATSDTDCAILACVEGEQPNAAQDGCDPCPRGSYQDQRYTNADCLVCPDADTTTRAEGATDVAMCEAYCPDGQEQVGAQCEDCPVGYFRNNLVDEFGSCEICSDPDFITAAPGATSDADCTIANCSAGSYREPSNTCMECELGQYQSDDWATSCEMCPDQTTTEQTGSTSEDQCVVECDPGNEDEPGLPVMCEPCDRGYYKPNPGVQACTQCSNDFVTETNGATDEAQCNYANCQPGTYVDPADTMACLPCPRGSYTDGQWQIECTPCGTGLTTLSEGADSQDMCITNCPSGQEYEVSTAQCVNCEQGYYRDQGVDDLCQLCPVDFVTLGAGLGTSQGTCIRRNCTAGQFDNVHSDACEACPLGEYQPERWQQRCIDCPDQRTTLSEGSTSGSDCVLECGNGRFYDAVTRACESCARGTYKGPGDAVCQDCPASQTTAGTGSTSAGDCNLPNCGLGSYIDQTGVTATCQACDTGSYQDETGQDACKPCPAGESTVSSGAEAEGECQDEDDCTTNTNDCVAEADGGVCEDLPGIGYWQCSCQPGYSGNGIENHGGCTHLCDEDSYCENGGTCERNGASASCSCTDNYKGSRCQTRKDDSSNETEVLIGATVGAGVGLLALILIAAALCCCCFRRGNEPYKSVPPPSQFPMVASAAPSYIVAAPSMMAANSTLPGGVITKPAVRYGGSTLGGSTLFANGDGASMAGFPAQKYAFYDEGEDADPILQNGSFYNNSAYDSAYEERGSMMKFS